MAGQSKLSSWVEAIANTLFGLVLAVVVTQLVVWLHNLELPLEHNAIISVWLTVVSLVRQYVIRRLFNRIGVCKGE